MVYYPGAIAAAAGEAPSAPGAMPAFSAVGTGTDTAAATGTISLTRPATLAVGDLMVAACYVGTSDATTITIGMTAGMSGAGWAEASGSPAAFPTAIHEAAFFWKIADASDVTNQGTAIPGGLTVSHNGSTTGDRFGGEIIRFTAADGFAANPFESVSSSNGSGTGNISMNTVTPTDVNRLGVTIIVMSQNDQTVSSSTGESGSDWTEANELNGVTEFTIQVQTCSLSSGSPVSGGACTHASGANWCVYSFALVPADV